MKLCNPRVSSVLFGGRRLMPAVIKSSGRLFTTAAGANLTEMDLHKDGSETRVVVSGYYEDGFEVHGQRLAGPLAVVPTLATRWKGVATVADITYESLLFFVLVEPKVDILLLGTGERTEFIHPDLRAAMRKHGIVIEAMSSDKALATFNILAEEARNVGAALLTLKQTGWSDHGTIKERD